MKCRSFLQKSLFASGELGLAPDGLVSLTHSEGTNFAKPLYSPPPECSIGQSLSLRYRQVHLTIQRIALLFNKNV